VNEDYSRPTWEKIQELAQGLNDRRWQARAQAELGIIAFLDGDVATAAQALKTALISLYLQGDMAAAIYYGSIVGTGTSAAAHTSSQLWRPAQPQGPISRPVSPWTLYRSPVNGHFCSNANTCHQAIFKNWPRVNEIQTISVGTMYAHLRGAMRGMESC
jgi:hypothetical protein